MATGQLPHRTNSPGPYILSYKVDIDSMHIACRSYQENKRSQLGNKTPKNSPSAASRVGLKIKLSAAKIIISCLSGGRKSKLHETKPKDKVLITFKMQ